jgi:hypothetical protein
MALSVRYYRARCSAGAIVPIGEHLLVNLPAPLAASVEDAQWHFRRLPAGVRQWLGDPDDAQGGMPVTVNKAALVLRGGVFGGGLGGANEALFTEPI